VTTSPPVLTRNGASPTSRSRASHVPSTRRPFPLRSNSEPSGLNMRIGKALPSGGVRSRRTTSPSDPAPHPLRHTSETAAAWRGHPPPFRLRIRIRQLEDEVIVAEPVGAEEAIGDQGSCAVPNGVGSGHGSAWEPAYPGTHPRFAGDAETGWIEGGRRGTSQQVALGEPREGLRIIDGRLDDRRVAPGSGGFELRAGGASSRRAGVGENRRAGPVRRRRPLRGLPRLGPLP
jgi:hypothetical protein